MTSNIILRMYHINYLCINVYITKLEIPNSAVMYCFLNIRRQDKYDLKKQEQRLLMGSRIQVDTTENEPCD